MDSKKKKKIVFLSVTIALVLVVAVSVLLYSLLAPKKDKDGSGGASNVSQTNSNTKISEFSNVYNDAMLEQKLVTSNYHGDYKLSGLEYIEFSEELSSEAILKLYDKYGVKDSNGFKNTIRKMRSDKQDVFSITSPYNSDKYGAFDANSGNGSYKTTSGKIYGDENLAVIIFDDKLSDKANFFIRDNPAEGEDSIMFISLTYKPESEANNATGEKNDNGDSIYVFETVYDKNNKGLKLFTVAYKYTLIKPPSIDYEF